MRVISATPTLIFEVQIPHETGADPGFSWGGGGAKDYVSVRISRERRARGPAAMPA